MTVDVYSPLSHGVAGVSREPRFGLLSQHLRYRTATSRSRTIRLFRHRLSEYRRSQLLRSSRAVAKRFARLIGDRRPDVVLISAYLMYYDLCCMMARACSESGIPVLVGGAYFAEPDVVRQWAGIPGVAGVVCGEVELDLPAIVQAVAGKPSDLDRFTVVARATDQQMAPAKPLQELDQLPFPDFSDFPWHLYGTRIIPILTGRGCGWGVCSFCSDVTSTIHRTYRSRRPDRVLDEIQHQAELHQCRRFVFTDLMLNSNLPVWHGILERMQSRAPGAEWMASIHVTNRDDNGLNQAELIAARRSGMVRLTTGFESGSQRVLDLMRKGTCVDRTARFVRQADDAGISVRLTMILGYPGEAASDVEASAHFLEAHRAHIERVQLNRFQIMIGSAFEKRFMNSPQSFPGITSLTIDRREAITHHRYREVDIPAYRRAVSRLFRAVFEINRRPLRASARAFDGVM